MAAHNIDGCEGAEYSVFCLFWYVTWRIHRGKLGFMLWQNPLLQLILMDNLFDQSNIFISLRIKYCILRVTITFYDLCWVICATWLENRSTFAAVTLHCTHKINSEAYLHYTIAVLNVPHFHSPHDHTEVSKPRAFANTLCASSASMSRDV